DEFPLRRQFLRLARPDVAVIRADQPHNVPGGGAAQKAVVLPHFALGHIHGGLGRLKVRDVLFLGVQLGAGRVDLVGLEGRRLVPAVVLQDLQHKLFVGHTHTLLAPFLHLNNGQRPELFVPQGAGQEADLVVGAPEAAGALGVGNDDRAQRDAVGGVAADDLHAIAPDVQHGAGGRQVVHPADHLVPAGGIAQGHVVGAVEEVEAGGARVAGDAQVEAQAVGVGPDLGGQEIG